MNQLSIKTSFLIFFTFLCSSLFAQWDQELIPLDDDIYNYTESLFSEAGLALPNLVRPWSRAELDFILEQLSGKKLSSSSLKTLNLIQELNAPEVARGNDTLAFRMDMALTLEYFDHDILYSDGDVPDIYPTDYTAQDHESLLEIPFHLSCFDNLYMESRINIRETPLIDVIKGDNNYLNIPTEAYDLDFMFPQRAYVSYGGENWNLTLGRFAEEWGNGRTGNMFLSANSDYLDHLRFTEYWDKFTFTYLFASLESRCDENGDYTTNNWSSSKSLVAHRFEFKPSSRFRLSLVEGLVFGGEDYTLSLTDFNPMMLYHNWFTGDYGNSYHTIESDYTLPHVRYYAQVCLDQYQSITESLMYPDSANEPSAYGILAGYETTHHMNEGIFHTGFECVYTSPYLYTYSNYYNRVSNGQFYSSDTSYIVETPLGYFEGPDSIVFSLYSSYEIPQSWSITGEIRYTINGENTIETEYPFGNDDEDLDNITPTGDAEYEWKFAMDGTREVNDKWSFGGGLAILIRDNPEALWTSNDDETYTGTLDSIEWNCFISRELN
jgi:hypothetical protein